MHKEIQKTLRLLRRSRGLSATELAEKIGSSRTALERYERNERVIPFDILAAYLNHLEYGLILYPDGFRFVSIRNEEYTKAQKEKMSLYDGAELWEYLLEEKIGVHDDMEEE